MKYIMALDQGTTSSRCILFDHSGRICSVAQKEFTQYYPQPGWVEHDAQEIWDTTLEVARIAMLKIKANAAQIAGIGITNQRETTIVWDKNTGEPVYNAIVWQCRRTSEMVDALIENGHGEMIRAKTGLVPDAYFSGTKLRWILDCVPGVRERAEAGELLFGTVDTWLVWVLTGGLVHATDPTNASRTMLYNIHEGRWDEELLALFGIPASMMPEVRPSSGIFGETSYPGLPAGIPIMGVAGDQQAALFGQCCFAPGEAKNTYGTGCFMLLNTGSEARTSEHGLVTTIAAAPPDAPATQYALEGSVFVAGALIQWLRDDLGIIRTAAETEALARSVPDTGGVYIVPAFTGLGAPWWKPDARGAILGLTRGTSRAHIARAALEALAYQISDLADAMAADAGGALEVLNVDGGASANDFLMQFQADLLGRELRRPANTETTSLGAAYLAGLASGFWSGTDELRGLRETDDVFRRTMDPSRVDVLLAGWHDAVRRVL